jgi:hypothetical protein
LNKPEERKKMTELQKMQVELARKVVMGRMGKKLKNGTLELVSVSESESTRITLFNLTSPRRAARLIQVSDSKIDGSLDLMEPGAVVEAGKIGVRVASDRVCFLQDDGKDEIRGLKKLAKELGKNGKFSVYMGHVTDDQGFHVTRAIEMGIEVFPLDAPEDWGYEFIAVRNRVIPNTDLRYDPLQPIEFWREMEISENDYRDPDKKVRLGDFLWGAKKIVGGEIPAMIQAQLHTLDQMVEVL